MRRFLPYIFSILLATSALAPPVSQAAMGGDAHVVPMQEWKGHIWVDVVINGQPTKAIVDTGCNTIVVPPAMATRLGMSLTPSTKQIAMFDRAAKGMSGVAHEFQIGDLRLLEQKVDVVDYPYVIVGLPVLGRYACTFDFDRSRLTLSASQAGDPGGTPMTPYWGLFAVQGTLSGQPRTFVIDTGADTTIASSQTVASIPRNVLSANEKYKLTMCRFQQIRIGNHALNYPELAVYDQPDTQSNTGVNAGAIMLGLPFWQKYNATFDFPAQRLLLSNRAARVSASTAPPAKVGG